MPQFRIKNQSAGTGYYTGSGWDADVSRAANYPSKDVAESFIKAFQMQATAEEVQGDQPNQPQPQGQPQPGQQQPQQQPQYSPGDYDRLGTALGQAIAEVLRHFRRPR